MSGARQAKETLTPGWTSWRERGCQGTLVANPFPDVSAGSPERHRKSLPQPISRRRGEVSLPLQCRNPHLSCRHGVHADSVGRPSESVLPDRTLSTLRALPALSRNAGGEAGEVARAGCEPGGTRRRERDLCPTQPHAETLGDAVPLVHHFQIRQCGTIRQCSTEAERESLHAWPTERIEGWV